jgi:hypothetical protein
MQNHDSSSPDNQPFDYTVEEWLRDFGAIFAASTMESHTEGAQSVREHFARHYPVTEERTYRYDRTSRAYSYLRNHLDHFDFGQAGVVSEREALVGKPVVMALYQLFSHLPGSHLGTEPPLELAVKLTKDWNGSA